MVSPASAVATTRRLVIEVLAHGHAAALVAALDHPSVGAYLGGPDVTTVEAMHARIDRLARGCARPGERWLNFAMLANGTVIGRLEATCYAAAGGEWAEIAYVLGPAHQGRGYAREGVRWLLGHLRAAGVRDVWAAVEPRNARSVALLAAVGFAPRAASSRPLASYDPGDLIFELAAG